MCATLNEDVRLDARQAADGIEGLAHQETGVQQKQGVRCKLRNLDCVAAFERKFALADRQQLDWWHRVGCKMRRIGPNGLEQQA